MNVEKLNYLINDRDNLFKQLIEYRVELSELAYNEADLTDVWNEIDKIEKYLETNRGHLDEFINIINFEKFKNTKK